MSICVNLYAADVRLCSILIVSYARGQHLSWLGKLFGTIEEHVSEASQVVTAQMCQAKMQ